MEVGWKLEFGLEREDGVLILVKDFDAAFLNDTDEA